MSKDCLVEVKETASSVSIRPVRLLQRRIAVVVRSQSLLIEGLSCKGVDLLQRIVQCKKPQTCRTCRKFVLK